MSAGAGATQLVWPLEVGDRVTEALQHQLRETVLGFLGFFFFFHLISRFYSLAVWFWVCYR